MRHNIGCVIQYCSHDVRFLQECIEQARHFSRQILVAVSDHFFDGTAENLALLQKTFTTYPDCTFIEFAFGKDVHYDRFVHLDADDPNFVHHWHSVSRLIPSYFINEDIEYAVFIDADEIFNGQKFAQWLDQFPYRDYAALRFASYYYFREVRYRATAWPEAGLFLKVKDWNQKLLLDLDERMGVFCKTVGKKRGRICGLDNKPMMHHYSWVRTKEEMLQKTRRWGHHWERRWKDLIEEEFSRPFNGTDFVRHYFYAEIEGEFDPLQVEIERKQIEISLDEHLCSCVNYPNVIRVEPTCFFRRTLVREFDL